MAAASLGRMLRHVGLPFSTAASRVAVLPISVTRQFATTTRPVPRAVAPEQEDAFGDVAEDLPAHVQRRVLKLKELQLNYDQINREYQLELANLQAKFQDKYQPIFDQRVDVVLGKTPVDKYDVEDDGQADNGIQTFWLDAFMNHDKIGPYITEKDMQVLTHLTDVRSKVLTGDQRGFQIIFKFAPNTFMKQTELTKTYILEPEDDVIPKEFIGCKIEWTDDRSNPTIELKKKRVKEKGGKKGNVAFVEEAVPADSFFNIFDPPQIPTNPEEMDDEEMDSLQQELTVDFDIGFSIKEQIIPRAVEWYTGELAEMEGDYDEYEEDFEDDMEEELPPPPPGPKAGKASRR